MHCSNGSQDDMELCAIQLLTHLYIDNSSAANESRDSNDIRLSCGSDNIVSSLSTLSA